MLRESNFASHFTSGLVFVVLSKGAQLIAVVCVIRDWTKRRRTVEVVNRFVVEEF